MIRLAIVIATAIKIYDMGAGWLCVIPFFVFGLDRWMMWESFKYEEIDDIPTFEKATMLLPAISIWVMFLIVLYKMSH
tara:strand:+ start:3679 stop:3912 length:234 start_codon:yes stop_codon:yes gene_type:complete